MIDLIGELRRIMNAGPAETFDQATDSLEAISNALGPAGFAYSGGLAFIGYCPVGMAPSNNVIFCPNLVGIPAQSFTRGYQMIVLRNANAPGNPPEMEMREITNFGGVGQFATAAFSANVEENDIVLVIHNSVAVQISAYGIADAGSGVGAVIDAARTEADDWWNGQTIMMLSGLARGQKRPIANFDAGTDTITPAPNFDGAVGAGDLYVILAHYNMIVPRTADDTNNSLSSEVVGRKDDTALQALAANATSMRYLKGLIDILVTNAGITAWLARSLPGNGVSLSEAVRYNSEVKPEWAARAAGSYSTTTITEETILTTAYTVPGLFYMDITLRNMIAGDDFTIRVYKRTDGANYDLKSEQQFLGNPTLDVYQIEGEYVDATEHLRVTIQRASGTDRAFPYVYNSIKQPVA